MTLFWKTVAAGLFRGRRQPALILLCLLGMALGRDSHQPLAWEALARGEAGPGLVRISGCYLAFADYEALVRGVLAQGPYALRVEGEVFDWKPTPGSWVEFWGALERNSQGYLLRFHNGRGLGESRAPRPAPVSRQRAGVWLKVRQTGSAPFPVAVGTAEDGTVFYLPADYHGPWGVVCLEGQLAPLGNGWSMRDVTPCEPVG